MAGRFEVEEGLVGKGKGLEVLVVDYYDTGAGGTECEIVVVGYDFDVFEVEGFFLEGHVI